MKFVINELEKRSWSQRELARRAGISHSLVANVLTGYRKPSWDFCAAIAKPLDKTPKELFRLAGLLPGIAEHRPVYKTENEGMDDPRFQELVNIAFNLSEEELENALEYLRWRYQMSQKKREKRRTKA